MKQKQNLLKKEGNRGITLVALVVTIVVLLILAGITITMLFSDSGIITKAREAAEATKNAQSDTEKGLEDLAGYMEIELAETAEKGKIVEGKFAKWTDESGTAIIPGGYCVVKDIEGEGEENKNTIKSGLVISDEEGDTLDNDENGNQFVWVPVSSEQLKEMYGVDSEGKQHGKLYNFNSNGKTECNWSEKDSVMTITRETSYREPDILNDTDYGDASTGNEENELTYNGIENLKEVLGIKADEGIEGKEEQNKNILEKWKKQLQSEFDSMIESVKKYGGFYIGRYETQGMSSENSNIQTTIPTVKKGNEPSTSINWYYMYQESKNIGKDKDNDNVTSSMIWGCQWDRTLEWIAQTNPKEEDGTTPNYELLTKSTNWGNYSGDLKTSGSASEYQKNHIYDLAGNAREWTLEADITFTRVYRGGFYDDSGIHTSASNRSSNFQIYSDSFYGSRSTLYINL